MRLSTQHSFEHNSVAFRDYHSLLIQFPLMSCFGNKYQLDCSTLSCSRIKLSLNVSPLRLKLCCNKTLRCTTRKNDTDTKQNCNSALRLQKLQANYNFLSLQVSTKFYLDIRRLNLANARDYSDREISKHCHTLSGNTKINAFKITIDLLCANTKLCLPL